MSDREPTLTRNRQAKLQDDLDSGPSVSSTRRRLLQLLGPGGVYGLAGCAGDVDEGRESATIALAEDPTKNRDPELYGGLSPYTMPVLQNLTTASPDLSEIEPVLATEWEPTGETTWEFTLREDVTFHNDVDLAAEIIEESLTGLLEETSIAWADIDEDSFTAVDDRTLEIATTQPSPFLPGNLAHPALKIHYRGDEDADRPIGTGPYEIEEVTEDQPIRATAFDDYWGETPAFEELTFNAIVDDTTRTTAIEGGEVEVGMDLPPEQFQRLEEEEAVRVRKKEQPRTIMAPINIYKSPTDDRNLRLALNYAIDQEVLVENFINGVGTPANGPFAPVLDWSAHDELPDYGPDLDQARELVEDSDYEGEEVSLLFPTESPLRSQVAEWMDQRFDEIGVDLAIEAREPATYWERFLNGEANLILGSLGSYSGATDYLIPGIFHSEDFINATMYQEDGTGIVNLGEDLDQKIDEATTTWDEEERHQMYREIQREVMEEAVIIPLYYKEYVMATRPHITGPEFHSIAVMTDWMTMNTE